jgi:hypothetical protein
MQAGQTHGPISELIIKTRSPSTYQSRNLENFTTSWIESGKTPTEEIWISYFGLGHPPKTPVAPEAMTT